MWRLAYRVSRLIKNNCTQHVLYHNSKVFFYPKDTGLKVSQRIRHNPFKSSGHLSRIIHPSGKPPGSDRGSGPEHRGSGPEHRGSGPKHRGSGPEHRGSGPEHRGSGPEHRGSGPEHRVSSELQKLSLEDLRKPELQKFPKKGKDRVMNIRLQRKNQDELVFGVAPCLLALTQGKRKLTQLFVKRREGGLRESVEKVCEEAVRRGVPIKHITKTEMEKMTGGAVHQGLCLQASPLSFLTKEKSGSQQGNWCTGNPLQLWLVLDGVQDPMNLGAVLRSAYFLGVDRVASSIRNSCPLTPVVSKASSGVMELMDVYGYENLVDIIKMKLKQGWQAVGTIGSEETSSGVSIIPCSDFKMSKPTLLLMGGEGFGLSPELCELCDVFLTVPPRRELHPAVDSLNVSVATGILLHSLLMSCRTDR